MIRSDSSHSKKKESSPATRRGEDKGGDSQVSVMRGHVDNEKRLETSSAGPEDSGAEPFFQSEVALARVPCRQETCVVHSVDLQREEDG